MSKKIKLASSMTAVFEVGDYVLHREDEGAPRQKAYDFRGIAELLTANDVPRSFLRTVKNLPIGEAICLKWPHGDVAHISRPDATFTARVTSTHEF